MRHRFLPILAAGVLMITSLTAMPLAQADDKSVGGVTLGTESAVPPDDPSPQTSPGSPGSDLSDLKTTPAKGASEESGVSAASAEAAPRMRTMEAADAGGDGTDIDVVLKRVEVSDTLNCYVEIEGDDSPEFYAGTACGTFVAYDGVVYGPADIPAGSVGQTPFTPIDCPSRLDVDDQEGVTTLRHCVALGETNIGLQQVDTYSPAGTAIGTGLTFFARDESEAIGDGSAIAYRAGDCYVNNSDYGTGAISLDHRAISCVAENDGASRIQQWQDATNASWVSDQGMQEAGYSSIWQIVGAGEMFDNTSSELYQDNGAGLSWKFDLAGSVGQSLTSRMEFTPQNWDKDTDGDELPDAWEEEGAGTPWDPNNPHGISLYEMGARVNVPDLFVEVDWMVHPVGTFLDYVISGTRPWVGMPEKTYRPSARAMEMIAKSFWDHGYSYNREGERFRHINLHIDAGRTQ